MGEQILEQIMPMRAKGFDIMKATWEEWQDPAWVYEPKYDGERAVLHVLPGYIGMTGRRPSDITGLLPQKGAFVPQITGFDIPELYGTLIDGELLHPSGNFNVLRSIMGSGTAERAIGIQKEQGKMYFVAFDLIRYMGKDLTNEPFNTRRIYLEKVVNRLREYTDYVQIAEQFHPDNYDIKEVFNQIVKNSGEGMVRKRLAGKYKLCPGTRTSPDVMKLKKVLTFDGIVTGYEMGKGKYNKDKVGKLVFSQYKEGELVERGSFDGFTKATIDDMTANIDKYLGRVVEVRCNDVTPTGKLRHPKFSRWRDDKPKNQCVWE